MQRHVFWAIVTLGMGLVLSLPFRRSAPPVPTSDRIASDLVLVDRENGLAVQATGAQEARSAVAEKVTGVLSLTDSAAPPAPDRWSPPPRPNPFPGAAPENASRSSPERSPAEAEGEGLWPDVALPTRKHRVVDGDSLARLAQRYWGDSQRWLQLYEANRDVLSSPDVLPIGTVLDIPRSSPEAVKADESSPDSRRVPIRRPRP